MIIKLMRLERKNWAGMAKYDGSVDHIGAFITKPHGLPHTGLNVEEANRLEKALKMEEGFLSPRSEFWVNYNIALGSDEELELDTSQPEDELIYLFLRNHMLVADGYANKRKNQFVQFVLFNPEEKAIEENQKTDVVAHAYALLYNMSHAEMLDALESTGRKVQSTHPAMVKQQLTSLVQKSPTAFVDMLSDKNYQFKLFILKCVSNGIIKKTKNNVETALFYYEDEYLGTGIDEVVNKLQTNQAQGIYMNIKRSLDSKIRANMVDNTVNPAIAEPSPAPSYSNTPAPKSPVEVKSEPVEVDPVPTIEPNGQAPIDLEAIAKSQKAVKREKPSKKVVKGAAGLKVKAETEKIDPVNTVQPKAKISKVKGGNTTDDYDTDPTIM